MKLAYRALFVMLLGALSLPVLAGGLFSSTTSITEPTPVASDYLGYADNTGVAYSADGQTALVAASYATVGTATQAGKAYFWHYANGKWTMMQEIDDPDDAARDFFGYSIALSADGQTALIGSEAAVSGAQYAGKAYLYTLSNGTWTKSHEFDDPAATADDYFGFTSVALSGHGSTAVIGAYDMTVNSVAGAGEAYIFSLANGSWKQVDAIPDPDGVAYDYFGYPVSISADGSSVLIGSETTVSGAQYAGKAYLYTLSGSTWSKAHEFDDPGAAADAEFGYSGVALSDDGKTALIGAYGVTAGSATDAGAAYIYSNVNGSWSVPVTITDPDAATDDYFGYPVAISGDGSAALVGSYAAVNGHAGAGKAYLYTLSGGTWTKAKEFDDPAATASDGFGDNGVALSYDGEAAFISAPDTTVNSLTNAGEAYLYLSPDDVSVAVSGSPSSVTAGQQSALDITVTNNDTAVTANLVTLTDTLPSGLSYVSANAAGGTCSASGGTVTCTLPSLAPGKTWQPTITVATASSTKAATYSDTASVTSNEPDPSSTNNTATASIQAQAAPPPSSGSSGGGAFGLLMLGFLGTLLGIVQKRRR